MTTPLSSILAADFGSVHTRAVLVDVVEGQYRLVAYERGLSTLSGSAEDLTVGLANVVRQMERFTGRSFYNPLGQIVTPEDNDRTGVDYFVTTASAGRPLRAVVIGLIPDFSLNSALRAISGAYVEAVAQLHLRDGSSEEDRLNAILLSHPDLIFIAGGVEGGAQRALHELLNVVQLALKITDPSLRPTVIYAGNAALSGKVHQLLGELTTVLVADNVLPSVGDEHFESAELALARAFDEQHEHHDESFQALGEMSSSGILPTAQSYSLVAEYYAKSRQANVIAVDIGSTSTVLVGVFQGQVSTRISTAIGLGHSADRLLEAVGHEAVKGWLPYSPEPYEIQTYALNKVARPATIPLTLRDLHLEHALLRSGLRHMVEEARTFWPGVEAGEPLPPVNLIVVGGSALTNTGSAMYTMLLLADSVQPSGVTEVKADPYGMVPLTGTVARHAPDAVVQLLEGDGLEHLGTLISIEGTPATDRVIASFTLITQDGERVKSKLIGGHLLSLPLPAEHSVELRIRLRRGYRIGGKGRIKLTLSGGKGGILIDARGRTFQPAKEVAARARQLPQWIHEATEDPLRPIPAEWLQREGAQDRAAAQDEAALNLADLAALGAEPPLEDLDDDLFDFDADNPDAAFRRPPDEDDEEQQDDFDTLRNLL